MLLKAYGELLHDDPAYAERAQRIASLVRDPVEIVAAEWKRLTRLVAMDRGVERVALHTPCTLQHGQRLGGRIEEILEALGLELTPVADAHLCCGSAGTYALLQPALSEALRSNKLAALEAGEPDLIATANIGCLLHIGAAHEAAGTALDRSARKQAAHRWLTPGREAAAIAAHAIPHFLSIPTRWMDNDIYGHVNNVVYLLLFRYRGQ